MESKTPITELPNISNVAVVALNRLGIVTISELLAADYDRVSVVLESFDEATRLIKDAKARLRSEGGTPPRKVDKRTSTHSSSQPPPPPATQGFPSPNEGALSRAFAYATRGLLIAGDDPGHRAALSRRLAVATLLLAQNAGEDETIAGLLLEPAEAGADPRELAGNFGPGVGQILEECAGLRAVPVSPSGQLPRYYLDMARGASRSSRRVCAADLLCRVRATAENPAAAARAWGGMFDSPTAAARYAAILGEALESGGPDPIVAQLRPAIERLRRSAA